jgi:hypothetical protein
MDPVSAGASVIALIQLADRLVQLCSHYIETVQNYPKDSRVILIEASSLRSILENLQFLLETTPAMHLKFYMA